MLDLARFRVDLIGCSETAMSLLARSHSERELLEETSIVHNAQLVQEVV